MGRSTHETALALLLPAFVALGSGCAGDDAGDGGEDTAGDDTAGETADESDDGETADESGDGETADESGDGETDTSTGDESAETGDPGPAGIFVAIGDGGRRASSVDALEWAEIVGTGAFDTQAETGEEDILRAVATGGGVAITVGGGGTEWGGNAMVMRSADGETWEEDLVGGQEGLDGQKLYAVAFADGVFVAGGSQAHLLTSQDSGQSWTRAYPDHIGRTHVLGVAGHGGTFVAVGIHQDEYDAPRLAYVHRSVDGGQSFEAPSYFGEDGDQLDSVASSGEVFVALGPSSCLRSTDGADWLSCGLAGASYGEVNFTNGRFVVTYLDGVSTSADGETWSPHVESPTGVPAKVVYGNGVYAGVRYYDRGVSEALGEWSYVTHGAFPLRDLDFLALE